MTINRRTFLKYMGVGTAGVLTSCSNIEQKALNKDAITMRTNHNSGDKVSILGYGCMRFPTLDEPSEDGNIVNQKIVNELVDYAIEHGVNYFDTAPVYLQGWSEVATGNALSRHPRSSYYVATKLSRMSEPTFENSLNMYHSSMKKLKVDYLDYYLLHSVGGGDDPFALFNRRFIDNGVLDYLLEERKAGRIRNLGFSFHGDVRLFDHLMTMHDSVHWDFVQIQLNYVDWTHADAPRNINADYLYSQLEERDIPVIVMEPLLGGRLANLPEYLSSRLLQRDPDASLASWAFRFAGSFPKVLTVLSGMNCVEHIEENIQTYSPLKEISQDDMEFLNEIATSYKQLKPTNCNDCKYCMPCPYGIDIPAVLMYYNKCLFSGNIPQNPRNTAYYNARKAFLVGYERSIPKLRQAQFCTGCGDCIKECPQKIDIPSYMRKIDNYVQCLKRGYETLMSLKEILHEGNHSLVISVGGTLIKKFDNKGVVDLYRLCTSPNPEIFKDTVAADKVIGRGAAILMILLGIKEVYADLISLPALDLFSKHDVRVLYDKRTDEILNNSKTDLCPVEKICKDKTDMKECVTLIGEFLKSSSLI